MIAIPEALVPLLEPISALTPNDQNVKTNHGLEAIKKSLIEFGWHNPIVATKAGVIIIGHGRLKAALALGEDQAPVLRVPDGGRTALRRMVADNRSSELSVWDYDVLGDISTILGDMTRDYDLGAVLEQGETARQAREQLQKLLDEPIPTLEPREFTGAKSWAKTGEPYYSKNGIVIYLGDSETILPTLPRVDLVLTDPPYGIFKALNSESRGRSAHGIRFGQVRKNMAYDLVSSEWDAKPSAETLLRVQAHGKKHVIWGGNYFAYILGACKGPLVWDKVTGKTLYADGEMAWSNVAGTLRIFRHQWCGGVKASERGDEKYHATQKPVALMEWCIGLSGKKTRTILDPYMGSGTTLLAARRLGLEATGIEVEERFCESAVIRLEKLEREISCM